MKTKSTNAKTISLFWQFTKPDKLLFWLGTIGAGLGTLIQDVLPPLVVSKAFNRLQQIYATGQQVTFSSLRTFVFVYLALIVVGFVIWRIQVYFTWEYEIRSLQRIGQKVFDHLQKQGSRFHSDRFGGALVSQANKFLSAYEKIADEFTWSVTPALVAFFSSLIILFIISWPVAVTLAFVSVVYMTVMTKRMRKQMPYDRAMARSESDRTAKLADMVTNVSAVRAFAGENHENSLFHKQLVDTSRANYSLRKVALTSELISHAGTASIGIIVFSLGIYAVTVLHAPVGTLYIAITYTLALTRRLWESTRVMRNLNRALGDASDMTEILQLEPEVKDIEKPHEFKVNHGAIEFNNVNFSYLDANNKSIFENLDFKIQGGEKIGLVGHSGGGKTTVTKLLLRFSDIQCGQIIIDGQDIAKVRQADLRSHIAYVPQEPLLFHRTIAQNIGYGRLNASIDEIVRVAKLAHAHEFIKDLPSGYDTLVGERGIKLSGGQRQRIAIARAMLKDAPILVLDEATSSLDSESELLIQDALWKLMEGRTAIVIAHRLSTIQKMDRIIVLENGKTVEEGSHKKLIAKKGVYAGLWAHQSGGFLED